MKPQTPAAVAATVWRLVQLAQLLRKKARIRSEIHSLFLFITFVLPYMVPQHSRSFYSISQIMKIRVTLLLVSHFPYNVKESGAWRAVKLRNKRVFPVKVFHNNYSWRPALPECFELSLG